jgi:hypothetical protein
MEIEVITAIRKQRTRDECERDEKPYHFIVVNGIVTTARGSEVAEVLLDKEHPMPERGKTYRMEVQAYPDQRKRLTFRVVALRERPVEVGKPKVA